MNTDTIIAWDHSYENSMNEERAEILAKDIARDCLVGRITKTGQGYLAEIYPNWVSGCKLRDNLYLNAGSVDEAQEMLIENYVTVMSDTRPGISS